MPHGHCYLWQPGILWMNVISDLLIALAYFSIPCALIIILKKRKDIEFQGIFVLFALFITCCGITHLFGIYTVWHGIYGLHGIAKAVTATVSVVTAIVLFKYIPALLALPTPTQLEAARLKATEEKIKRTKLEVEKKANDIFKYATELIPTGLLVVDNNQHIRIANTALGKMFGYENDELVGKPLSTLLPQNLASHHQSLVDSYVSDPKQNYAMATGRVVRGLDKKGNDVSVEINLSTYRLDNQPYSFATVSDVQKIFNEKSKEYEQSNRIKRAIDATNDGIWEWNLKTNGVWFSQRMLTMIGADTQKDTPNLDLWKSHIHERYIDIFKKQLSSHFKQKSEYDVVYLGLAASGKYEWFRNRGNTIFDHNDQPVLMSGTLTNIHKIKLLESELNTKTQFLDAVLSKSLCGLFIFDIETQSSSYINRQYTSITGYTADDLKYLDYLKGPSALFHPDDLGKIDQHMETIMNARDDDAHTIMYRFLHKEGHYIWCLSKDSVYSRNEAGEVSAIIGTFFDISELKEREEEIKRLALDFSTTFEQAAVGIAHVALDGTWLKANNKLCDILGYSRDELLSMTFQEITYKDDLDKDLDYLKAMLEGSIEEFVMEKRYYRKTGQLIWANLTVSIVKSDPLTPSHFIAVIEDISQRKYMQHALAQSNKALERFAYSASHDLQEPLRKISAFSDSLTQRLAGKLDDEDAEFELERISDASTRMREMIHSLLQLSRFSTQPINKNAVLLSDLIATIAEDLSPLIDESNACIEVEHDCTIYVDEHCFHHVFSNLIANSIRYAKKDQPAIIKIKGEQQALQTIIDVTDNGVGFDSKYASEIFAPFRRLVGRSIPGHGMGLAICQRIIEVHNGNISAKSDINQGTTITICLPNETT